MKTWQKYAAEAYGTFVLVGMGAGAILGSAFLASNLVRSLAFQDVEALAEGFSFESTILTVSLAFGFGLILALSTVGSISGGHFNPAVSLAAFLDKQIGIKDMLAYWGAQVVGSVIAMLAFAWMLSRDSVAATYTTLNREALDEFGGFIFEAILTAVFVYAILVLMRSSSKAKYLTMGFALAAINLMGFAFTGASVNPARSFAPALVGGEWEAIWVYVVGPLVGGVIGWVLYKVISEGDLDLKDDIVDIADRVAD